MKTILDASNNGAGAALGSAASAASQTAAAFGALPTNMVRCALLVWHQTSPHATGQAAPLSVSAGGNPLRGACHACLLHQSQNKQLEYRCSLTHGRRMHACKVVQGELATAQASIAALPNVGTYIAALGPASNAYAALPSTLFTDLQGQVQSFASSIQQARPFLTCTLSLSPVFETPRSSMRYLCGALSMKDALWKGTHAFGELDGCL